MTPSDDKRPPETAFRVRLVAEKAAERQAFWEKAACAALTNAKEWPSGDRAIGAAEDADALLAEWAARFGEEKPAA